MLHGRAVAAELRTDRTAHNNKSNGRERSIFT